MPSSTDDLDAYDGLNEIIRTSKMRPDAVAAITEFVRSVRAGRGGSLFVQAPYVRRDLMEIGYRSESWLRLAAG